LALLEKVTTAVDCFGSHQDVLVLLARTLHELYECLHHADAQVSGIAIDIVLDVRGQHGADVLDEVE